MRKFIVLFTVSVIAVGLKPALAKDHGFIFGTVTTEWGDQYTGRIRWDKNEGFWDDILDATKDEVRRHEPRRPRTRKVKIFGLEIFEDEGWDWSSSSSSQIRFGHIKSIEPRSRDRAIVTLKNGETVRFEDSGSDLGSDNRGITLDVADEGLIEFDWRDIDMFEFMPEPDSYEPTERNIERLYGRVETDNGDTYTGFVIWDADEIYTTDILDGDERGRDRELRFGRIESIRRRGSSGCDVVLKNGRDMRLTGSNDVDDGNRGIVVMTADMGRVDINWEDFEKVEFMDAPPGAMPLYDDFDGGRRLFGTVTSDLGDEFTGEITWDNDEEYTWEFLNGEVDRIEFDIEFANIESIDRQSRRGCRVTLHNGMTYELRGSNDVDEDNKGIFIETNDGDLEELDWDDFVRVVFRKD